MKNTFYRFEFKYRIPQWKLRGFEFDCLQLGLERDPNSSYIVSSLYFDKPVLLPDYDDKAGGFLRRKKVRARIYGETIDNIDGVWLEIKEKYDMMIYKRRIIISVSEWNELLKLYTINNALRRRLNDKERRILEEFIFDIASVGRRPHILVSYKRKPFFYYFGSRKVRLTLDYQISALSTSRFGSIKKPMDVLSGWAVIELKYNEFLPVAIRCLIEKYNLGRDAYSKYALGVEAVRWFNVPAR